MPYQTFGRILVAAALISAPFSRPQQNLGLTSATDAIPHQNVPLSKGGVGGGIEMLTDTEGVDFNSYLRDVYLAIKKSWFRNIPDSVEKGEQGKNVFEFHVLQDGSVPKDSLKMVKGSDKNDLDVASLQGIREATPFEHLPEKFSKPYIVLRFTFFYNLPIPRPH